MNFLLFILGLLFGSFLNVLVSRYESKHKKWYQGRSYCDACKRQLKWWENIPLFSFLFLKGKCRTCRSPIPYQYPLVELTTGILFFIISYQSLIINHQSFLLTICYLLLSTTLITITLFDLKYMIIPDWTVLASIIFALLIHFLTISNYRLLITNYLLSAFGSFAFLGLLHLITKGKGMGLGDVKFSFFMGLFLGWPQVLIAFYVAFLTGALIGVILILMGKKRFKQHIAFGPFLVLGTIVSWFWGQLIISQFYELFI